MLLACIVLAGCKPYPGHAETEIELRTLSDGTRCAVIDQYAKVALTCDWQSRPASPPVAYPELGRAEIAPDGYIRWAND
jgi:hypothetical protein